MRQKQPLYLKTDHKSMNYQLVIPQQLFLYNKGSLFLIPYISKDEESYLK